MRGEFSFRQVVNVCKSDGLCSMIDSDKRVVPGEFTYANHQVSDYLIRMRYR